MQAWTYEPTAIASTFTPSAGVLYLARIYVRGNSPVYPANIGVVVTTGGTGATALANCFCAIYDSTGTKLASSDTANQATNWATAGFQKMPMTAAQLLQPGANYWIGMVVGTQSTTAVVFGKSAATAAQVNMNLGPATARFGSIGSGNTSCPASFAIGSQALSATFWASVL